MIEIALIVLKFAALITGGIFAAIGLLTNYRHEDGTVSKWGKIALFGIVLSTIIGAGTQAVETYRDRDAALKNDAANRKSEEQTRKLLGEIKRAVYPLRDIAMEKFVIVCPITTPEIEEALKHLNFGMFSGPNGSLPTSYSFAPQSASYPTRGILLDLFEPVAEVRFWREDVSLSDADPDLRFLYQFKDTEPSFYGGVLRIAVKYVRIPQEHLELSHRMASLDDLRGGRIQLIIRGRPEVISTGKTLRDVLMNTRIETFTLSIANHAVEVRLQPDGQGKFEGKVSTPD